MSLKLRLTVFSTVVLLIALSLISLASYNFVANALEQQLDTALEERAGEVLDDIAGMGPDFFTNRDLRIAESTRPQTVPVFVQVVDHLGTVRYTSDPLGRPALPIDKTLIHQALKGATLVRDVPSADGPGVRVRYAPLAGSDAKPIEVLQVGTPLVSTENALSLMRVILASATLLGALLVGLGVWLAASHTLAAVDRVTRTASAIERSQSLSQRIAEGSSTGEDELSRLVRTFNSMLDRLEREFATQRQFVADSSHELRSPLTVIRGNLDLLPRVRNPAEQAAITRQIEEEAARMSRLVDNLLFLAQLGESARPGAQLDRRPVELDSLLLTVYQQARAMTDRHTVVLGEEDAITIEGDRDQLQQLLLNLVENAIKYTPPGGTITLSLRNAEGQAVLEVCDTGIGIPPDDLPHIFDRFYRVDKARSRRCEGAGLGLAIVRSIAASHGGTVLVVSTPGEGTTFTVQLPLTSAATSASVTSAGRGPHWAKAALPPPLRR